MNKQETIDAIQRARKAHVDQMNKIKLLVEGKYIDNLTSVLKTQCAFGHWLYGDKESIKNILGVQFYNNLDVAHEEWHMQYSKIYAIFADKKEKRFFSKFFKTEETDNLEIEKTKVYYKELEKITNNLLKFLDASQRRVQALSPSKFY